MDERKRIIEDLKPITRAIVDLFGPSCEALIHDLTDLEHSIVWIEGNLTHRGIGSPITDVGLIQLREDPDKDIHNYISTTEDGKVIKSTSVIYRNKKGEPLVSLSVNLDITPFQTIEHILHGITRPIIGEQYVEHFSDDVNDILDAIIYESEQEIGKSIVSMSREEKVSLVQKIDERGAFQIKKAAPYIAKRLGVTRYTVYNYLNESRGIVHADSDKTE